MQEGASDNLGMANPDSEVTVLQNSMQDPAAYTVALQHNSFHNTAVICRLLCLSKALHSLVLQHSWGQLSISISLENIEKARDVGTWIQQHGQLLRSLVVERSYDKKLGPIPAGFIAASLHEAAAAGLLQLRSVEWSCGAALGLTLQQLSPQFLTELDVNLPRRLVAGSITASDQELLDTFGQLSGLRKLTVCDGHFTAATITASDLDPIIPVVARLGRLTHLRLLFGGRLQNWQLLLQLPEQLQQLEISLEQNLGQSQLVQLNQLTALTSLVANHGLRSLSIRRQDMLPANLKVLRVLNCLSCKPLLQLQHLQELDMSLSTTSAHELQSLSQLTTLTHVQLRYGDSHTPEYVRALPHQVAAADMGWSAVPGLHTLVFDFMMWKLPLSANSLSTIRGIGRISHLQQLHIIWRSLTEEAASKLPAALQQLTALTALELNNVLVGDEVEVARASFTPLRVDNVLACSIAGLPRLTELHLEELNMTDTGAAGLSGASQLLSLALPFCSVTNDMLACVLSGMSALKSLDLSGIEELTAACAPSVLSLKRLTGLNVCYTNMVADLENYTEEPWSLSGCCLELLGCSLQLQSFIGCYGASEG